MVDVSVPELREKARDALDALPAAQLPRSRNAVAAITDVHAPAGAYQGLEVVRLWTRGRTPGSENPFRDPAVRHVISATPAIDPVHLSTTRRHLVEGLPIRLWQVVTPGARHARYCLQSFADQTQVRESLAAALMACQMPPRTGQELTSMADELVANALYDAPVDGDRQLFAKVSRKNPVPCPRPIDVELVLDDSTAAILVRDYFGSLSADSVVENLARCYAFDRKQIDHKEGGAGLGLFMVLVGSSRLIINIMPNRVTEIIVTRDIRQRPAAFRASAPTLNICVTRDQDLEARHYSRRKVSLAAVSVVDGRSIPAVVLDVTAKGAFIEPLADVHVEPDQAIVLTVFDTVDHLMPEHEGDKPGVSWQLRPMVAGIRGTVRWVGLSQRHGRPGFGVEFDQVVEGLGSK